MSKKVNYINEVELKSLLIRAKNKALEQGTERRNNRIKELVQLYIKLDRMRFTNRMLAFRKSVKSHIVKLCEKTRAGEAEMTRLSDIVSLMVDRILTKPQFSGYTYDDEFHSDAQFKVFKYITNFDHTKISKISGEYVNAFAYTTQIIHNSIIYVISTNKKHQERIKQEYKRQQLIFAADAPGIKTNLIQDTLLNPDEPVSKIKVSKFYYNKTDFYPKLTEDLEKLDFSKISEVVVHLPKGIKQSELDITNLTDYNIKFIEYANGLRAN